MLLDDLHEEMVASWPDRTERARTACRIALEALLTIFEQGDLDERTLERVRSAVLTATSSPEEADELLRAVRAIGVGRLGDQLADRIQLSHEERWELQREASVLGPELLGLRKGPEASARGPGTADVGGLGTLLEELARSGPDLR